MSVSAAILIIAIVIIRALAIHKLPKRTFLVLWGVALLRLLIPFSISSPFSIYTAIAKVSELFAEASDMQIATPNNNVLPNINALAPFATSTQPDGGSQISLVLIVWIVGVVGFALFFLVTHLRYRREYKSALPVDNNSINEWLKQYPTRRSVQIKQSDRIKAPMTYGLWNPVILLPKITDWQDGTKLRYVLTHELTHIKRFDILSKWLLTVALCVHWFNPLVWVMYVLANRDIELSCDEKVVLTFGETTKSAYALTLIGLEEKKSGFAPLCNNFAKNAIEERINAIMKTKKFSVLTAVIAVLLVVGTTTVFASSALTGKSNNDSQDNNRFDPNYVYETNENGQTYGPAMYAPSPDKEPDLIQAESLDGKVGYVYASDVNYRPNSPEELLAYTAKNKELWDNAPVGKVVISHTVPLYAVDGKTVIGEHPITIGFKDKADAPFGGSAQLD